MIQELQNPEIQKFIKDHENHDPSFLLLHNKQYPPELMRLIVQQIQGRKIAKTKIPSWYSNEKLIYSAHLSMEQCSSETTARYKSAIFSGQKIADLTGGTGVDSYFLSKSFKDLVYVEKNHELVQLATHNFKELGIANSDVEELTAEQFLETKDQTITHFYIDPSRRTTTNQKVFLLKDCEPDVTALAPQLISRGRTALIKASPLFDIEQAIQDLKYVNAVHIVSVDNECKEVLYLLNYSPSGNPQVFTINIKREEKQEFFFSWNDKHIAQASFSLPSKYLYEPNASILKSGAFNIISQSFQLAKLHPNSHLYTSETLTENFPGRSFVIKACITLDKKKLHSLIPEKQANITVRNFPLSVAEIRKRTGLKEGGNSYIFATTDLNNKPVLVVCEK